MALSLDFNSMPAQDVAVCGHVDKPYIAFDDRKETHKHTSFVQSHSFRHACESDPALKSRCISCLIDTHRKEIDALRILVSDFLLPENDDLWLLRYILSFKQPEDAAVAIEQAQKWRHEHADMLAEVAKGVPEKSDQIMTKYLASSLHMHARDGSPIYITRVGLTNPKAVSSKLTDAEIQHWMMYNKEKCFLICDGLTRTTGLLMKSINIIDFANAGTRLLTARDKRVEKCLHDTSSLGECMYPQLVHQNILFNVPIAFKWVISCVKTVMPRKMAEKVVCCPTRTDGKYTGAGEKCPFISEVFDVQKLPTFLGGHCACDGGCVYGTGNDQTSHSS